MHIEEEITVEVDTSYEELLKILRKNHFHKQESFLLRDIYLIHKNEKKDTNYLSLLNKCVLVRSIITKKKQSHFLTYKYKEYLDNGDIKSQSKVSCKIDSPDNMTLILNNLDFEELIKIDDQMSIYVNDEDIMGVQWVNNKHLYIEVELDKKPNGSYKSLEEIKGIFKKYNIPVKDNNYYVKKAEIELKEKGVF